MIPFKKMLFLFTSLLLLSCERNRPQNQAVEFQTLEVNKIQPQEVIEVAESHSRETHPLPKEFTGKIIGIKDGDTVEILYEVTPYVIRLAHIDCPEKKQPFGTVAKQHISDLIFGKTVKIVGNSTDRYKRLIAEIYVDDTVNVNKEMVKSGLAWHFKRYSKDVEYAKLEETARQNKTGLWSDKNPVAPWEWR